MNNLHSLQNTAIFSENKAGVVRTRRFMLKLLSGSLALALTPATIASAADLLLTDNQGKTMKIVMLTGSPHRQGTSALLADEFSAGASSKGHTIVRFDTALKKSAPAGPAITATNITANAFSRTPCRKLFLKFYPQTCSCSLRRCITTT